MLDAAMPVLAVTETTETFLEYFFRRAEIMARNNSDLPVPMSTMVSLIRIPHIVMKWCIEEV